MNLRITLTLNSAKTMDINELSFKISRYKEDFAEILVDPKLNTTTDSIGLYQTSMESLEEIFEVRTSSWYSGLTKVCKQVITCFGMFNS